MKLWRLKKGADRRLRQGHPWVFASELNHSAKEAAPGELVELRDSTDHFLAIGYTHPSSQICFRKVTANAKERDVFSTEFFVRRLRLAREHRQQSGWTQFSHRWLFAESDGVPGLVIDAFLTAAQGWLVVVQASTVGAERALPQVFEALKTFEHELGLMSIIEAPSSRARLLEGLALSPKNLVSGSATDLSSATICLVNGLKLEADILNGQKTGFFLDQQWNSLLLTKALRSQFAKREDPVRVLDICSYVGQWAAQSASALAHLETDTEVTLLDVSQDALRIAERNLRGLAAEVKPVCADALEALSDLPKDSFDVVICDPPAFVKKKADLDNGVRAYIKLYREAIRRVKPGGIFVASSCSGLVKDSDWRQILVDSSQKAGRSLKQIFHGGHGPDHPVRPEFPEGEYLKCEILRCGLPT